MEKHMRHSSIKFGKNTITKITAPDLMFVEIEKTRRAFEISKECGLFRVPEILDYDEARGIAIFERIVNIQPVIPIIKQCGPIIEKIGRSLAIIHQSLSLPPTMNIPLPHKFDLPGTEVFLHGDFNGCNVCLQTCSDSIVILDWQMTSRHGGQATYGSRYFDIIWFVNYMLWTSTVSNLFYDSRAPMVKCFLESYFNQAGIQYDANILKRYAIQFFTEKRPLRRQHASWKNRWLIPRNHFLTQRFIHSLTMQEKK